MQDVGAPDACDDRHGHRDADGQPQGVGHVAAHVGVVARAEALRHRNAESAAAAVAESQDEEDHRTAGAYARQGVDPQKLAHDGRVDQRIGLLQQVAQQQGQREIENQGQRRPRGHLPGCRHSEKTSRLNRSKDTQTDAKVVRSAGDFVRKTAGGLSEPPAEVIVRHGTNTSAVAAGRGSPRRPVR